MKKLALRLLILGSCIMVISTAGLFLRWQFFTQFYTPLMWTGYILLADGLNYLLNKKSYILTDRKEFVIMLPFSIGYWYIFEFYNLFIDNWYYIGLPENMVIRIIGYFWAFATIWPGVLETFQLIQNLKIRFPISIKPRTFSPRTMSLLMVAGAFFSIVPILLPYQLATYTAVLVWTAPVLLIDPILFKLERPSVLTELKKGSLNLLFQLFLAGAICGFLWELWNYKAATKWIYKVPFGPDLYIFEMPVIGFLGFLPFAVEIFLMWELTRYYLKLK
ncbi:MAG: hypothetical protein Kow00108_20990 [Calditrichia bacterium]